MSKRGLQLVNLGAEDPNFQRTRWTWRRRARANFKNSVSRLRARVLTLNMVSGRGQVDPTARLAALRYGSHHRSRPDGKLSRLTEDLK